MMALGFAMVATATAGTVIHAPGVAQTRRQPIPAIAARTPPVGDRKDTGFYESLTQPIRR